MKDKTYDIIVVGGGHAGTEAAYIGAKMKADTLLLTMDRDNPGFMSCNPAIGGVGKGQIVKEIDALGGLMGLAADEGGIQFKKLNRSKGEAVHSSRAQEDRELYKRYVQKVLYSKEYLTIKIAEVSGLIKNSGEIKGVKLKGGQKIYGKKVVLTPGTFLNGVMHIGLKSIKGGRIDEESSQKLSEDLKDIGFDMLRFKTGTCPRLKGDTIDFSGLDIAAGDKKPEPFSLRTDKKLKNKINCYVTYTNEKTHKIIRDDFKRSPLITGKITGKSVRYCPSVEDKLVKFSSMDRHRIFLEPESRHEDIYYPNGISTSLPKETQEKFIHSIKGLQNAKIVKYGYGIEHDIISPLELKPTLETKKINNLYLAGQINGTTGYEEAAAQGLLAGINAVASSRGDRELVLKRHQAYIGVLIDDLVTKGTPEPYRMFTSRAEYRLLLREDNVYRRLFETANRYGTIDERLYRRIKKLEKNIHRALDIVRDTVVTPDSPAGRLAGIKEAVPAEKLFKNPNVDTDKLIEKLEILDEFSENVLYKMKIELKYEGYINKQKKRIKEISELEKIKLSDNLNYEKISSLSNEEVEKLNEVRPENLARASRISGITPSAITTIMVYLKGEKNKGEKDE